MGRLPAEPAADTLVVNEGHRVRLERVAVGADGQGRAGGNTDAGMIPGTGVGVDPEAGAYHTFALLEHFTLGGFFPPLDGQHAFTLGDDDFQPLGAGVQGLPEHFHPFGNLVGVDRPDPFHPEPLERGDHVHSRRLELGVGSGRRNVLGAGGGGVAVVHNHQYPVVAVEDRACDPGGQAVVPESSVPHDRDHVFPAEGRGDSSGTCHVTMRHFVNRQGQAT